MADYHASFAIESEDGQPIEWLASRRNTNEQTPEDETEANASRPGYGHGISIVTHANIHVPFWTEETTTELIAEYGTDVINGVNRNGVPLLCDAIIHQQLHSAEMLLEYISDNDYFVDIKGGSCPTLDWAIKRRSVGVIKFILDYLVDRRLSMDESCTILTNYMFPLIKKFPALMEDYLEKDKFAFEYGRFTVPYSMIKKHGKCPIAMTTNEPLVDWKQLDSTAARNFWMQNSHEHAEEMAKTSDLQVDVVAKFFCINQHMVRSSSSEDTLGIHSPPQKSFGRWKHVLGQLATSKLPISIFKSESIRAFTNWVFFSLLNRFLILLILDMMTAGLFSSFAGTYGLRREGHDGWERWLALFLIVATFLISVATLLLRHSKIKLLSVMVTLLLMVHVARFPKQSEYSAFLTSIGCILCWILVVEALLPFDKIGPFVSMVKYSFEAIIPFCSLGGSILIGFAFAFRVLFNPKFYHHFMSNNGDTIQNGTLAIMRNTGCLRHNDEDFSSFFHVLKILFQAAVGNFEEKVFRSTDTFIGVWRSVLFNGFIFSGGVVLISLLIAILGDTYNSVRFTEKEELVKCRAKMGGATLRYFANPFSPFQDRIRALSGGSTFRDTPKHSTKSSKSWLHRFHLKAEDRQRFFHYLVQVNKTGDEFHHSESKKLQFELTMQKELQRCFMKSNQQFNCMLDRMAKLDERLQELQETSRSDRMESNELKDQMKIMQNQVTQMADSLNRFAVHKD